ALPIWYRAHARAARVGRAGPPAREPSPRRGRELLRVRGAGERGVRRAVLAPVPAAHRVPGDDAVDGLPRGDARGLAVPAPRGERAGGGRGGGGRGVRVAGDRRCRLPVAGRGCDREPTPPVVPSD